MGQSHISASIGKLLMRRLIAIILLTLVLIVGSGLVFLMTWDIPAPSHTVEKTLNDSRFPR